MRAVLMPVGSVFGRLTVLAEAGSRHGRRRYHVQCVCGATRVVTGIDLRSGNTQSCGCQAAEKAAARHLTHGMSDTALYRAWQSMLDRCRNPNSDAWPNYGGRGIKVARRWLKFENFYADMGDRPHGCELDRRDNSKGYSKANCRWVPRKVNARNTRSNKHVVFNGERVTVAEAAELSGIRPSTLYARLSRGDADVFRPV